MKWMQLIFLVFLLTNCSTIYGSQTLWGGYKDTQYSNNQYSVSFLSGLTMTKDENYMNCLYRCSEIAVINNKHYFKILRESDETTYVATGNLYDNGTISGSTVAHPKTVLRIELLDSCPDNSNCFNAHEVIKLNSDKITPSRKLKKERGANSVKTNIQRRGVFVKCLFFMILGQCILAKIRIAPSLSKGTRSPYKQTARPTVEHSKKHNG